MKTINGEDFNTYHKIHMWIRYHYGSANKCENTKCAQKSKSYQWALKPGKRYQKNITHFQMLCASCHRQQDIKPNTGEKISKANNGMLHKISPKDVHTIVDAYKNYTWGTNARLAKEMGTTPQHICWVVRNAKRLLSSTN